MRVLRWFGSTLGQGMLGSKKSLTRISSREIFPVMPTLPFGRDAEWKEFSLGLELMVGDPQGENLVW